MPVIDVAAPPRPYRRVLIVDDNPEAARGIQNLLPPLDSIVRDHATAAGAVGAFKPDLILLAMKPNPGAELRRLLHRTPGIPILALTYPASEADARAALSGRASDFLYRDRVNDYVLEKAMAHIARIEVMVQATVCE